MEGMNKDKKNYKHNDDDYSKKVQDSFLDTIFDANFATNLDNDYSIYVKKPIAKSNIPNYNNGDVSIQDFAAQLANEYLFNSQ